MNSLPAPQELLQDLSEDQLFKDWKKQHQTSFLSHFFCPITGDYKAKTNWEIGFFDKDSGKITVFAAMKEGGFEIKPADDIFKKETDKVQQLEMEKVKSKVDEASERFKEGLKDFFQSEQLGDGFLILQNFKGNIVWNFSFITKTIKFINIKICANDCNIVSHDVIELVQK